MCKRILVKYGLAMALLLCIPSMVLGQQRSFRVMSYNVENLFDTCHDAGFDDHEFLPESSKKWDSRKYWKKQGGLARSIVAACGASPIELIALCEIENDTVVRDLSQRTKLHRMGYEYLVTKSRDARGVDVALLYQPDRFKIVHDSALRVPYDKGYGRYTRDILHVAGRLPNADTLDIFVNHWPSRRGGTQEAEDYRWTVARFVKNYADSLMQVRCHPNVIFVGDFNDEYNNRSIADGLGAIPFVEKSSSHYVVLSANLTAGHGICGTFKYKGKWNQLDQIIVSRNLLDEANSIHTTPQKCRILDLPFLMEKDDVNGGVKPYRTYQGPVYKGGISDHFPMLLELQW